MRAVPTFELGDDGSVVLQLADACIQTTARRAQRALSAELVAGATPDPARASALGLLERFLAATDFAQLRTEHPTLAGGVSCRVRLAARPGDRVAWTLV